MSTYRRRQRTCPRCKRPFADNEAPYVVTLLPEWLGFGYPSDREPGSGRWENEHHDAWTLAEARRIARRLGYFATIRLGKPDPDGHGRTFVEVPR